MAFFVLWLMASALTISASPFVLPESGTVPRGALRMPFSGQRRQPAFSKRQTVQSSISNDLPLQCYTIDVAVGSPAQSVTLEMDTGSSDTWMFGPNACPNNESGPGEPDEPNEPPPPPSAPGCGGGFDPDLSSSLIYLNTTQNFTVEYADDSTAEGYYVVDSLEIGGITVAGQVMAVATEVTGFLTTGILGLGLQSQQESSVQGQTSYPTILDNMQSQGIINVRAYSVYLDDLESSTGAILFGGIDTAKFTGNLTAFPIQNLTSYETGLAISLSSIAVTDQTGGEQLFTSPEGSLPSSALLDTGSTVSYLPDDIFQRIKDRFGVIEATDEYGQTAYYVPCSLGQGQVDFTFGNATAGDDGPVATVSVQFSELAIPQQPQQSSEPSTCIFGFAPAGEAGAGFVSLGDTFMRSAYVLYNFDSMEISVAQSNPGGSGSDIYALSW